MLSGNDHGEDAYGILEPDVQTIILDGMQNGSLRFLYPDNMCHNSVLFMIYKTAWETGTLEKLVMLTLMKKLGCLLDQVDYCYHEL